MTSYVSSWISVVLLLCLLQSSAFFARAFKVTVHLKGKGDDEIIPNSAWIKFDGNGYGFTTGQLSTWGLESSVIAGHTVMQHFDKNNVCFGFTDEARKCSALMFANKCSSVCDCESSKTNYDGDTYDITIECDHTLTTCLETETCSPP